MDENDRYIERGGETYVSSIPGLKFGGASKRDEISKSDSGVRVTSSTLKSGRKEDIKSQESYNPRIDDRGTKGAERLIRLNQRNTPTNLPPVPPLLSTSDAQKTMGTYIILGSLAVGFFLGRWSTKINLTIGE